MPVIAAPAAGLGSPRPATETELPPTPADQPTWEETVRAQEEDRSPALDPPSTVDLPITHSSFDDTDVPPGPVPIPPLPAGATPIYVPVPFAVPLPFPVPATPIGSTRVIVQPVVVNPGFGVPVP